MKLLSCLFDLIASELDYYKNTLAGMDDEKVATWWSRHLVHIRANLYSDAIKNARQESAVRLWVSTDKRGDLSMFAKLLPVVMEEHAQLLADRRETTEEDPDHNYDIEDITEYAALESARQALGRLITILNRGVESKGIKIVIYVDEAQPLVERKANTGDGKSLYDHLCTCLNRFRASPIFVIFLSTNSNLVEFAAPRALLKSARIRGGYTEINPPITEMPFDCKPNFIVKPGTLTMEETSNIPFLAQFGRPL